MTGHFVIAVDGDAKSVKDAITTRLAAAGYGYWHWMEDVWLVTGVATGVTAQILGEWLEETPGVSSLHYLVLEVAPGKSYWGRNIQPSWDWMSTEWRPFLNPFNRP